MNSNYTQMDIQELICDFLMLNIQSMHLLKKGLEADDGELPL